MEGRPESISELSRQSQSGSQKSMGSKGGWVARLIQKLDLSRIDGGNLVDDLQDVGLVGVA